ncbi:unnamed protein product [Parnassius mnemosyne]|uniref:Uncharacterized protein n=1 Tax=Parnassius mnemosyne TaxID=213953 RepID=A0AAV1M043_9NEOP
MGADISSSTKYPILNSFVDVFAGGKGGKPERGTMRSTCWARGGICVEIRHCPQMIFDAMVPGCNRNYRVCCKVRSPTVGISRKNIFMPIDGSNMLNLEDSVITAKAIKNYNFLRNLMVLNDIKKLHK